MSDELGVLAEIESNLVTTMAERYSDDSGAGAEVEKFDFDAEFQTKVAAHSMRDIDFMRRAAHLIAPEYFENAGEAALVSLSVEFYRKYGAVPDAATCVQLLKEKVAKKLVRGEQYEAAKEAFKPLYSHTLTGGNYVAEKVAEFCRNQAVGTALLSSVDLLGKKNFAKIGETMQTALNIGINEDGDEYDYFDRLGDRTDIRTDMKTGKIRPNGITTGYTRMDDILYHKGWGRKELSIIMGGAKSGKTTALINYAKYAVMAGKNVLYVSLEVGTGIIADRLDASFTSTEMKMLSKSIIDVKTKLEAMKKGFGKLKLHEYPPGTFSPSMLRRLIERYKSKGIVFDLVVCDYADIMAPDFRMNDAIENSKGVYTGLRAIAVEENLAMLSATQTNRDGFKSTVAKAEHVAEDFNKIRIADLVISINVTDEERAANEARLYFAASRNQESGFTIFIKQDISRMQFITSIVKVE